jgi:hypothetical protein
MPSSLSIPIAQALQRHIGNWKQTPPPKKPMTVDQPAVTSDRLETSKPRDSAGDDKATPSR